MMSAKILTVSQGSHHWFRSLDQTGFTASEIQGFKFGNGTGSDKDKCHDFGVKRTQKSGTWERNGRTAR